MTSVVICTYKRAFYLEKCLAALLSDGWPPAVREICVIDNADDVATRMLVASWSERFPGSIRYVAESRVGLSHARNKGAEVAVGPWLHYLDDDARIRAGYFDNALDFLTRFPEVVCFGGPYEAWFLHGKPRWMWEDFGTMTPLLPAPGHLDTPELAGGNYWIRKDALLAVGGFPVRYGMSGTSIGYAEENVVQAKLLAAGHRLGFDPRLMVDHAVLPHKLRFSWHLRNWYAHGRDGQRLMRSYNGRQLLGLTLRSLAAVPVKLPGALLRWVMRRDYFRENLVWDVLGPLWFRAGQWSGRRMLARPGSNDVA
jgi:glycosyltransferase involved in cell wall biosynthesis